MTTRRDICPHGHTLKDPNLVPSIKIRGIRNCLACSRARAYCRYHEVVDGFREIANTYYEKIKAGPGGEVLT